MRTVAGLLVAVLCLTGCEANSPAATPVGCGMVPSGPVTGLLGSDVASTATGTLTALRRDHRRAGCASVDRSEPLRSVRFTAEYHPAPVPLPAGACSDGWVYAGTPEKFTPACQDSDGRRSRTRLIVRWQPYVMRVTISRLDKSWAGDPEAALEMTRVAARRLGVAEARGDG
jgi:hypothetical protein